MIKVMEKNNLIECSGFYFIHSFDSGNLGHVERVPTDQISGTVNPKSNVPEIPDYEFNVWTRPDCAGTEFENGNRTWFYFGIQASEPNALVRLNLINLNKQGKMYNQGMAPVTRTLPGKPQWERIRDKPIHTTDENTFTLSFRYRTSENVKATTFFAFTYPFSFAELQIALNSIDLKMLPLPRPQSADDIYYCRECLVYSLEGRRVDLLTISSYHGITQEREERLKNLFPENTERPFKFANKKVIFMSARVHPGETPSSFVFNGFLNLVLTRGDPIAVQLRKLYVFKMIPFLNPDGVARGHYRTDTRGVNLNRVYLNPSFAYHPTVYASRALIRYHHFGEEKEDILEDLSSITSRSMQNISECSEVSDLKRSKRSSTSTYRSVDSAGKNKSTTTIKMPSDTKKEKDTNSAETTGLAEQVLDMKLVEEDNESEVTLKSVPTKVKDPNCLLNEDILKSCLGSEVHLSTSEELNTTVNNNPLRSLRDTLKNSISLLMESNSSVTSEATTPRNKDTIVKNLKMGWCQECRHSIVKLEDTMPGIADMVPGYSSMRAESSSSTFHSIDEYREHQRQITDDQEAKKVQEENSVTSNMNEVYFCTNCFKKYYMTANNEEIVISEPLTSLSEPLANDRGDVKSPTPAPEKKPHPPSVPPPPKDKPKSVPPKPSKKKASPAVVMKPVLPTPAPKDDSGLYLYIDLHGHASKKGIFMYGNHFEDMESSVECMLLPRIMSLNNIHFHFSSCNFTERNMYLKDRRDGMSREGSGRVAVLKATGLVRSYTLECNYNTGRLVNVLPPRTRDDPPHPTASSLAPPKYTPHIYEEVGNRNRAKRLEFFFEEIDPTEVGRALGASILDLTSQHPNSRIPSSEHRSLAAVRDWLKAHTRSTRPQMTMSRLRPKNSNPSPTRQQSFNKTKGKATEDRKENTFIVKPDERRTPPYQRASEVINMNVRISKDTSRTRFTPDEQNKPKTLAPKRRNILSIRKPNASKSVIGGGVVKAKVARRAGDDTDNQRSKTKRTLSRGSKEPRCCRAMASSSSSSSGPRAWEESAPLTGKRRPFPAPPPRLKKIRLKTAL